MTDSECQTAWSDCLKLLSTKIKPHSYSTWFSQTNGLNVEGNIFNISVPNKFVSEWLGEHYIDMIKSTVSEVTGSSFKISFKSRPNSQPVLINSIPNGTIVDFETEKKSNNNGYTLSSNLNNRYSFGSFVVGESNQFAHAAAMAIAESPGKTKYNPLYIYGGVGLGKTHLAQAIGNFVKEVYPGSKVLYITSEKFTSDFINSITSKSTNEFVNHYRNVDVLLLDDIQFFAGKESTQVQFFHTFNVLYQTGKQIVLTSDRAPKDIKGLEERLLSRFHWGLVTDIQPPDLETRIAILNKKIEEDGITIPEDVILYIAENVTNNIREIEGSLIRLLAYSSLTKRDITLENAVNVLKDTISEKKRNITVEIIKGKVALAFKIPEDMLNAKKKTQDLVAARQVAMYLSRKFTDASLKSIGLKFGGRDHSTVIHAVNQVSEQCKTNPEFKNRINDIINSLYT
ncbi:MAG: chromosomal replication initiator protein DnaA [candidate division Zixibacteria bacterium]|nr:chromosomal replication initiator protein DnaA [candidate division Zixibacteria bacterium]